MNKGIVMDIKKHNVVVLTPNGEFITFERRIHSYMIGEEISFNEQEQRAPRFSIPSFLKPASLLVTCFLCVLLFFYNQPEEKVFAYVSVDINPSLEVSVTKDLRVIDLRACNDDGRRILKEMKRWKNKHLEDVIRTIIKQSQEDKYLTNDKQVMLTAVTKDKSLEPQLEKAIQELKKEYEIKHITVEYQSSTMQIRENAMKAGVGTGVYVKQENEKQKSFTPPALPSNQEQPKSSPDVSSDASSAKEERYEKQENNGRGSQQGNNGHQQENNGRGSQQGNNGHQQENNDRGSQQGNNGNQQENNGRGSQQGNNGNQQENNGRGSQGNNGNQQENNGRGSQGNNGNQQENNGRGSQQGNNGHQQENNGRASQGNNGHQQENNGRGSQKENNGNQQENNGRGSQGNNGHQQENNGRGSQGNNGNQQGNNGRGSQ
ncbi:anti-sigma factor domain-containing protein [Bacillus cereus]|nr:anti-sigma factor domain-containing protein [Bacillus cereus]